MHQIKKIELHERLSINIIYPIYTVNSIIDKQANKVSHGVDAEILNSHRILHKKFRPGPFNCIAPNAPYPYFFPLYSVSKKYPEGLCKVTRIVRKPARAMNMRKKQHNKGR